MVTTGELMAPGPVLTLLGFSAIVALSARSVPGAALIGILGVTATGITVGVSDWQGLASLPPDAAPTLLALDVSGALQVGMIPVILTFLIVDLFDTAGTLIGVAQQAKLLDDRGRMSGMQRALIADSTGTVAGALFGTSPVTSYVESAAGTSAGGRRGLTAVVAAGLFLLCLFFAPLDPKPHRPWIAPVTPPPRNGAFFRAYRSPANAFTSSSSNSSTCINPNGTNARIISTFESTSSPVYSSRLTTWTSPSTRDFLRFLTERNRLLISAPFSYRLDVLFPMPSNHRVWSGFNFRLRLAHFLVLNLFRLARHRLKSVYHRLVRHVLFPSRKQSRQR